MHFQTSRALGSASASWPIVCSANRVLQSCQAPRSVRRARVTFASRTRSRRTSCCAVYSGSGISCRRRADKKEGRARARPSRIIALPALVAAVALALVVSPVVVRAGGLSGVVRAGFVGFVVTGLRLDVTGFVLRFRGLLGCLRGRLFRCLGCVRSGFLLGLGCYRRRIGSGIVLALSRGARGAGGRRQAVPCGQFGLVRSGRRDEQDQPVLLVIGLGVSRYSRSKSSREPGS